MGIPASIFCRFVVDAKIYEHMLNEKYQKDKQK